ncbi:hypothetical protein [Seonamhaeicola maritimus]|uniref:Uncharacterized protein n=1 Tax=Seonamhaeicola maritimus TaxID=2591822 RepID=A0A5C7GJI0_9FLAO|nr:hypothetical protein [Seonamhaeicola maritimus]TXG38355.1 hypothetical protein FUA22_00265 [Seonamhaeicola maritimus]
MNTIKPSIDNDGLHKCLETKINIHLNGLNKHNQSDNQKTLELCQVGKFLCTYFPDYNIIETREQPDFIISNGSHAFGLEHQSIYKSEVLKRTGFYDNIALLVEKEFEKDSDFPNFLVSCYLRNDIEFSNKDKRRILNTFIRVIREFVLNDNFLENEIIDDIRKMNHSQKSVNVNFGGYMVPILEKEKLLEAIQKKERKIDEYIKNTEKPQWLLLLIGGVGAHSYRIRNDMNLEFETKFEKIFILEDFDNRLYELK